MRKRDKVGTANAAAGELTPGAQQQVAFENEIVGIGLLENGRVVQANRKLASMFGYEPSEMAGLAHRSFYVSDEAYEARVARACLDISASGSFASDVQLRRRDGSLFWGYCGLTAMRPRDPSGGLIWVVQDITDRKQAEKARARLAAIVENSNDAIISRALDGAILTWNKAAERLFGYSEAEAVGKLAAVLMPLPDHSEIKKHTAMLLAGERIPPAEVVRTNKDGQLIDALLTISPIRNDTGEVTGASVILRDISVLKHAQHDLQRKADLAQLLEALARDVNEAPTPQAAMRSCVARICGHGGWTLGRVGTFRPGQLPGIPLSSIWHCPDSERFDAFTRLSDRYDYSTTTGKFISIALREKQPVWIADIAASGGSGRFAEATRYGLRSAFAFPVVVGGEVAAFLEFFSEAPRAPDTGFLAAVGSIAGNLARAIERQRADESQAQLAAIVQNSNDAIISRALDGTILSWNAAAERLLGYSASEAIGQPITIAMPPGDYSDLDKNSQTLLGGGQVPPTEVTRLTKDGRRIEVLRSVSPIRNETGDLVGAAIIIRDISELKRAERELQHKAELAQLLEALARAVNEAGTPEAAMQACVARICKYGSWVLGRVGSFAPGQPKDMPQSSIWHCPQPGRFDEFIKLPDRFYPSAPQGIFTSAALREKKPIWVTDFEATPGSGRFANARRYGIRAGFVFPVIVGDEVQAFLEFFADKPRPPDATFLEAIGTIASQLARVIERKHAGEIHAQLAAIVESSGEAIISRALDRTILTWNNSAERLFGYSAAEAIGSSVDMLVPPDRVAETQRNLALLHQGQALSSYETVRLTKDGRRVHVSIGAAPIRDDAGNVTRVALIFRDITERKRAEIQLRLAASVFESAAEGIIITDRNNDILSVNQAFTEITGYSAEEAIGENPRLLSSGWQEAAFYQEMWNSIKETGRWQGEIWDRRKNGEVYCGLLSISTVRDERGEITHHCAIFMDITQRKAAEAAISRLNADLENRVASRTAELERINKELEAFSYSVSHDLRAPLRAINGFSKIVLEENKGKLDEDSVKHLQRIRAGGERMERLIDDLLTLSHLSRQAMHRQDIDLTELAHQAIDALTREHPGRNAGVIVAPGIRGNGDPGLIRIVLENLIGNAWKFTSRTSEARIEVGIEDHHGETAYFVRDNGAGFNMKYADKLFSPFKRLHADKEFEGTGIGLSIVERIITRHGGRVWAESKEGQGAIFYFTLGQGGPLSTPDTGVEPAPKPM